MRKTSTNSRKLILLLLLLVLGGYGRLHAQVQAYTLDATYYQHTTPAMAVSVSVAGTSTPIQVRDFQPKASISGGTTTYTTNYYYYAEFSFQGTATVTITPTFSFTAAPTVSPAALNIPTVVNTAAGTVTLTLTQSTYAIVAFAGQPPLLIAADPYETIPASSGTGIYNVVTGYGVTTSGTQTVSDRTTRIQNAINAASSAGGGLVYVPDGVYLIGRLLLKSNVNLYLHGGAALRASDAVSDFPTTADWSKSGVCNQAGTNCATGGSFLISTDETSYGSPTTNISITGRGTIDGNGYLLRQQSLWAITNIMPRNTSNFKVDGITGWDAGFWSFIVGASSNVSITNYKGLEVINDADMTQDDALDVVDSSQVTVNHAMLISQDDASSTKVQSLTSPQTSNWGISLPTTLPIQDVHFNSLLVYSVHSAFKIGESLDNNTNGVTFSNSYSYNSGRTADIHVSSSSNPVNLSNVVYSNIDSEQTNDDWFYEDAVSNTTQANVLLQNINIRNANATNKYPYIYTPSASLISNVTFSNVVQYGSRITNSSTFGGYSITNLQIRPYVVGDPIYASSYSASTGTFSLNSIAGGGTYMGAGKNGYSLTYSGVDFGTGVGTVNLVVAVSSASGGSLQLVDADSGVVFGSAVPASTGGWTTWATLPITVADSSTASGLVQGVHDLQLNYVGGSGSTIANVMTVQPVLQVRQAECPYAVSGITYTCDPSHPEDYISVAQGNSAAYHVSFGTASVTTLYLRVSSLVSGDVEIRDGSATGTLMGVLPAPITGAAGTWQTVTVPVTAMTGTHALFLVGNGRTDTQTIANVDWFSY